MARILWRLRSLPRQTARSLSLLLALWLGSALTAQACSEEVPQVVLASARKVLEVEKKQEKKPGARPGKAGRLKWLDVTRGVALLRAKRAPAIVWCPGGESVGKPGAGPSESWTVAFDQLAEDDAQLAKTLSSWILIRVPPDALADPYPAALAPPGTPVKKPVRGKGKGKQRKRAEKPDPGVAPDGEPAVEEDAAEKEADRESVASTWKTSPEAPVLLIVDFRERVLRRFETAPKPSTLRTYLKKTLRAQRTLAKRAVKIEKRLAAARRALIKKRYRQAVLGVRVLDTPKARRGFDATLDAWTTGLIGELRALGQEALDKGERLEEKGDNEKARSSKLWTEAVKVYQHVAKEFPFKDIADEANRAASRALRKLTPIGESPFGR